MYINMHFYNTEIVTILFHLPLHNRELFVHFICPILKFLIFLLIFEKWLIFINITNNNTMAPLTLFRVLFCAFLIGPVYCKYFT